MTKHTKKRRFYFTLLVLTAVLWLSACSAAAPPPSDAAPSGTLSESAGEENATVHFLDVGEGNATLIESDGKYMLVDGGDNKHSSYVVSYLKKHGVKTLDYIVVSHYDADHVSGIVGALHAFDVNTVLGPDYEADSSIYQSFLAVMEEKKPEFIHPSPGDAYELGSLTFTVVGPMEYGHKDENSDSVAIRVDCGDTSFLLCGDAQADSEKEMVDSGADLKADVYLVNHHGSETSTTEEFLEKVDPDYAVISSSTKGNRFEHPRKAVLDRLEQQEVSLYRTDKQGTITADSDGSSITFDLEPCNDFTPGGDSETELTPETVKTQQENAAKTGDYDYIVNKNSLKFHLPGCSAVESMKEENKLYFKGSREEAVEDGYEPCGICKP